ncbi:MAG TPA: TonB-dependent receptor [Steroidobacteraceae bacterium]|nr:TonB-dependent receptor [Steroidobacteraceae bacterium]
MASTAMTDEAILKEVIVTASLGRNPLDVAQPTTVLSGDDLSRQLTGSLGETLSRQLGISSSYFGPAASRPVIRGLGGYRVQTLQDGLATLDVGSLSDDHATTIDPALSEQLEILKGPSTLLYGSGASGGLVNVVTRRIPARNPGELQGLAELRAGSAADELAGAASLSAPVGQAVVHAEGFKSQSRSIDIPASTMSKRLRDARLSAGEDTESSEGVIPNAFSDSHGGALGVAWLADLGSLGGASSRYETTYGIPSEATAFIAMRQDRYETRVEWRPTSWPRSVQFSGAYSDYTHTEYEAPGEPGTVFTQQAYELRLAADHRQGERVRGTFGTQVTHIDFVAAGDEAFVPPSVTTNIGIFILEETAIGGWTFSLGARGERQAIDADLAGVPQTGDTSANAAAGAIYKWTDTGTFALNITHTARHPQVTELYANGPHIAAQRFELGDATLDTETANTIDLSIRRDSDTWSWLLSAFYNDYRNFIFADPTGNTIEDLAEVQYRQAPATLFGYEAELWAPLYRSDSGLAIRLRVMSDYVRGTREGGQPLPQIPPLRVGVGLHIDWIDWHAEIDAIRGNTQNRTAINELATDDYVMLNADASYSFNAGGRWLLFLRGTNLLDDDARQHASALKDVVPLPGRSISAGARIEF